MNTLNQWWNKVQNQRIERAVSPRAKRTLGVNTNKRAKAKVRKDGNWFKRIAKEMRDNETVIENVSSGSLDRYL
jgi:hypothetical protein